MLQCSFEFTILRDLEYLEDPIKRERKKKKKTRKKEEKIASHLLLVSQLPTSVVEARGSWPISGPTRMS